jgi:hypothetical protein
MNFTNHLFRNCKTDYEEKWQIICHQFSILHHTCKEFNREFDMNVDTTLWVDDEMFNGKDIPRPIKKQITRMKSKLSVAQIAKEIMETDVTYLNVQRNQVVCHYVSNGKDKEKSYYSSLSQVMAHLPKDRFIPVNQGVVIARNHIEKTDDLVIKLDNGTVFEWGVRGNL